MKTSALVLFCLCAISSSFADEGKDEPTSNSLEWDSFTSKEAESFLMFIKALVTMGYAENKLNTIAQVVEAFKEDAETNNITLVAYQNVYNADGTVKEVKTIELFLPVHKEKSVIDLKLTKNTKEEEFDASDFEKIHEVKDMITAISYMGLNLDLFYKEENSAGSYDVLYIGKNLLAMDYEGVFYANQTIVVDTLDEIENEYKKHTEGGTGPYSYLAFDKDGKFLKEKSHVVPEMLVTIDSDYEHPSNEIVKTTIDSLATSFLEAPTREEVPEKLSQTLQSHYPGMMFTVTTGEPVGSYIYKDWSIHLKYEYLELEEGITYSVYGYNKTTTTSSK